MSSPPGISSSAVPRSGLANVNKSAGSQVLYYRIYTKDSAIATKRPAYSDNLYIGRTRSKWVAPPSTARSLRLHLSGMENIDASRTVLYLSPSSKAPSADDDPIAFNSPNTPGLLPELPVILISEVTPMNGMKPGTELFVVPPDARSPLAPQILYYGIYNESGVTASKSPIDAEDPWISKLDLDLLPPTANVAHLSRLIAEKEGITPGSYELFGDRNALAPLDDDDHIVAANGQWLGSTPDDYVRFKYGPLQASTSFTALVEGKPYHIVNASTGKVWVLFRGTIPSEDLYLYGPPNGSKPPFSGLQETKFDFRKRDKGFAVRNIRNNQWVGPDLKGYALAQSLYLLSSKKSPDFFFICTDHTHKLVYRDPQGPDVTSAGGFRLELGKLNTNDVNQMWRLVPA